MLSVVGEVGVNLIAVFIVFVVRLLGFDVFNRGIRFGRRLSMVGLRVFGVRTVLLYTDCDDESHTSRTLASHLQKVLKGHGLRLRVVVARNGSDLMRRPTSGAGLHAVVLLLTDVTQLTSRQKDSERFQRKLARYAHGGGCLVLGHDVIYRRSRNKRLQQLAGCTLDRFVSVDRVHYVRVDDGDRVSSDPDLLAGLPPAMSLSDNEVVIGTWRHDVQFLYRWQEDEEVPLVTRRTIGHGKVYWLNSGDSTALGPPLTLARPDKQFVAMLGEILRHA